MVVVFNRDGERDVLTLKSPYKDLLNTAFIQKLHLFLTPSLPESFDLVLYT